MEESSFNSAGNFNIATGSISGVIITGGGNIVGNRITGDNIQGDKIVSYNHPFKLAEAAQEIQDLLDQLSNTYPTDTRAAKNAFADEIVKRIDANPSLNERLLNAIKSGGLTALEQFLSHPAAGFVIAALEDWEKTQVR